MSRNGVVALVMLIGLILSWIFSSIIPFIIAIVLYIVSGTKTKVGEPNYPKD